MIDLMVTTMEAEKIVRMRMNLLAMLIAELQKVPDHHLFQISHLQQLRQACIRLEKAAEAAGG